MRATRCLDRDGHVTLSTRSSLSIRPRRSPTEDIEGSPGNLHARAHKGLWGRESMGRGQCQAHPKPLVSADAYSAETVRSNSEATSDTVACPSSCVTG